MDAKLIVVGGEVKTTEVKLKLPSIVGRGKGAGVLLQHPLVSRQHCEIYEHEGQLAVRDLGSLNGTYINNTRLTEPTVLPSGDLLTIGTVTFRAEYTVDPNLRPPAAKDPTVNAAGNQTVAAEPQADVDFMASIEDALEDVEEIEVVDDAPESESMEEIEVVSEVEIEEVVVEDKASSSGDDDFLDDMLAVLDVEEVDEVEELPAKPVAPKPTTPAKASAPAPAATPAKPLPESSAPASKPAAPQSANRWAIPNADDHETLRARPDDQAAGKSPAKPAAKPALAPQKPGNDEPTIMQAPTSTPQKPTAKDKPASGMGDADVNSFLAGLASNEKPQQPSASTASEETPKPANEVLDFLAAIGSATSRPSNESPAALVEPSAPAQTKVAELDLPDVDDAVEEVAVEDVAATEEEQLAGDDNLAEDVIANRDELIAPESMFTPDEEEPQAEAGADFSLMEVEDQEQESANAEPADFAALEDETPEAAVEEEGEPVAFEFQESEPEPNAVDDLSLALPPVAEAAASVEVEEVEEVSFEDVQEELAPPANEIAGSADLSDDDFTSFLEPVVPVEDTVESSVEFSLDEPQRDDEFVPPQNALENEPEPTEAAESGMFEALPETSEPASRTDESEFSPFAFLEKTPETQDEPSPVPDVPVPDMEDADHAAPLPFAVPPATEASPEPAPDQPAVTESPAVVKPKKRPHAAPRFPFTPQSSTARPPAPAASDVGSTSSEPDVKQSAETQSSAHIFEPFTSNGSPAEPQPDEAASAEIPEFAMEEAKSESPADGQESEPKEEVKSETDQDDDFSAFLKNLGK